ncbi:unnamed protein product [Prunus armeniaca]
MGVYYNISKFQPNWINQEASARQRLNQVHRNVMLAAITFNVATSLKPCAAHGQPHMGVKSAQELRRMDKSQAFHKETILKHVFGSWSSWQVWAAGAVGMYGQLEQLGAAKRGVLHQPKGRMKLHSINRELHTHSKETHTFTSSITLIHTFRFTTKREESLELSSDLHCCQLSGLRMKP